VTALAWALGTSRSHVRRFAPRYNCDLDAFRASRDRAGSGEPNVVDDPRAQRND
jgi:hypothetical protein